jgi:hypothetical protein
VPPSKSNKPSPMLVAPVGGFLGFLAGIGLALVRRRSTLVAGTPAAAAAATVDEAHPEWHADWEEPAFARRGETIHRADDPPVYGVASTPAAEPAAAAPARVARRDVADRPDSQTIF